MKKFLTVFLILMGFGSWKWKELSLKNSDRPEALVQTHWIVDTVQNQGLRKSLVSLSPPLLTEKLVIAGNFIDGVKAYDKKRGSLVWDFKIPSAGVSKPLIAHKGTIYFGGRDGFFYSLDEKTGSLKWKYYTGSELAGQALVEKDRLYFLTQDQKLYVLDLKGSLIWIHSHPAQSNRFHIRGNISPVVKEGLVYVAFQKGIVKALRVKDASLVWSSRDLAGHILSPLKIAQKCLLVPVFKSYNYCLDFKKGNIVSKSKKKSRLKFKDPLLQRHQFPAEPLKAYLIYGSPSYGKLEILKAQTGEFVNEYSFGRGLAGPLAVDVKDQSIYFLSIDARLYKISLL